MAFRLFRIRLLIARSCILSFVIIAFLQFMSLFNGDNIEVKETSTRNQLSSSNDLAWKNLLDKDKSLTDQQRIKKIELIKRQTANNEVNWTHVFFDSYTRKLKKMNERDIQNSYKYRFQGDQQNVPQKIFEIFEETPVFQRPKFCSSKRIFHPGCPYTNCRWICREPSINRQNLRRASVFHHVDISDDDMKRKAHHRSANDIWILWIDEANRAIEHLNQYRFNWTLSFRQDSEVSIGSYGVLIPQDKTTLELNDNLFNNSDFVQLFLDREIDTTHKTIEDRIFFNFRYRYKHALWFVSNCGPQRRLKYYEQLKPHYPIKAYGVCVKNKCERDKQCSDDQSYLALFYLAFESQTCKDYISEKFWRALYYGMIPIVLGPSKQSYLDLDIPSSAFIHVDDFRSPKHLANHLHEIANDYFIYRKYFQWLKQYEAFYDINVLEPIRMCELCMRLNMQEYQDHRFYTDLHQWHRAAC